MQGLRHKLGRCCWASPSRPGVAHSAWAGLLWLGHAARPLVSQPVLGRYRVRIGGPPAGIIVGPVYRLPRLGRLKGPNMARGGVNSLFENYKSTRAI